MKIAVFTDSFRPQKNGVVVFLSQSLEELSKEHQVLLFAPGEKKRTEQVNENYKIFWMPSAPFPFYEGYRMSSTTPLAINKILKEEKPDLVHLHAPILLGVHGLIAAKKRKMPIIATYHTHFPDYLPHLLRGKLYELVGGIGDYTAKKLIKLVYSRADISTAPTKELVKELESYGIENVVCLPNGVDVGKMKKAIGNAEEFKSKFKIPKGKKIILYAGRVSLEKRIEDLLDAFSELGDQKSILLIVGSGPSLEKYQEMAKDMKNVIFTGFVSDEMLSAAYSVADVFASASDSETFGLTFVEAMAFGLPVVGVNKLGAKQLIDGNNGFAVEPGDKKAFAEALRKIIDEPKLRKSMKAAALRTSEGYTMEKCMGKTLKLYKKLVFEHENRSD